VSRPEATIVVTTRNRPEMAKRAIRSALGQEGVSVELLVVDDGSDPPFETIGEGVRIIRRSASTGAVSARNNGLSQAEGDWTLFLDDDDELLPHALESSLSAAERHSVSPVCVMSGMEFVDESGKTVGFKIPDPLRERHSAEEAARHPGFPRLTENTLLAPTTLLKDLGGFDEELQWADHLELFIRLHLAADLVGIPAVTYRLFAHTGPRVSGRYLERALAVDKAIEKHRAFLSSHPHFLARLSCIAGMHYVRAGQWRKGVSASTKGLARHRSLRNFTSWAATLAGPRAMDVADGFRRHPAVPERPRADREAHR
jgi:glycosyltransferase involved in cell wall biosynthesis